MRVPNISTYVNSTYRLGTLTSKLEEANEIASTQKRINEISDDPLGLSQVISLKDTLGNLDQIKRNVNIGKSWIRSVENSMDSINDLILEIKVDAIQLANDSMTSDERNDSIERVESVIQQIITLGNTQINGNYIFSGTDSDIIPLEYDKESGRVIYKGNEVPFEIRTDKSLGVEVGRNGQNTFWDQEIQIDSTNNTIVFKEDNGHGDAFVKTFRATIPDGMYYKEDLETAIKNVVNDMSAKQGYGLIYIVDYDEELQKYLIREDGTYSGYMKTEFMWETGQDAYIKGISSSGSIPPEDINITIVNKNALTIDTPEPAGSEPFRLVWEGNGIWHVMNNPGYTIIPSTIEGTADSVSMDLNESGVADITINLDNAVRHSGDYIEFDIVSGRGDHSTGHEIGFNADNLILAPPVSDSQAQFVTQLSIINGTNDRIDFVETDSSGGSITLSVDLDTGTTIYTDMAVLAGVIESGLETASNAGPNNIDYTVSYDTETSRFNIRENGSSLNRLDILWNTGANSAASAGTTLGYYNLDDTITYPVSDTSVAGPMTFDNTNNIIDFRETNIDGSLTGQRSITIPEGVYANPSDVAAQIQSALQSNSVHGVDYIVDFNAPGEFMIKGSSSRIKGFELLWETGENFENNAAQMLGFDNTADDVVTFIESDKDVVNIVIDGNNNKLDFMEITPDGQGRSSGKLTAIIDLKTPPANYTSHSELAQEVEEAMELESRMNGNSIDYSVSWDDYTKKFTIKENGTSLSELHLMWHSGDNAPLVQGGTGESIGSILGFSANDDDIAKAMESSRIVEWGIFNTLIDLKQYLSNNDRDGIERTIGRLETNYDHMTSRIVDAGMKFSRLEVRETITTNISLSLTERRSTIEDADMIKSIMDLKNIETAYQAALSATAKVLDISLVDYLR